MKYYFFVILLLLGSCAINTNTSETYILNRVLKNIDTDLKLDEEIIFVADNQFHNIYSDPSLLGSRIADEIVSVAIRPPQLNLFSPDLFVFSLKENAKNRRIIHLGDALNISSSYEWHIFLQHISEKSIGHNGWVMVPGNHDVYYYGNGAGDHDDYDKRGGLKAWTDAANTTGVQISVNPRIDAIPFTKERFVEGYLDAIKMQNNKGFPSKTELKELYLADGRLKSFFEWQSSDSNAFITRLAGKYIDDDKDYWRSFIVQELSIRKTKEKDQVSIILIDSTNYISRPSLTSLFRQILPWSQKVNSGVKGQISEEQQYIINRWVTDIKKSGGQYILSGHHPFNSLTKDSQRWMMEHSIEDGFVTYISAHTHDPIKAYKFCQECPAGIDEFNIGSITDTPKTTPNKYPALSSGSPQYAILKESGVIITKGDLALTIRKKALGEGFEPRKPSYYTGYQTDTPWWKIWNSKKEPHRNNLKIISRAYLDMFEALQPKLNDDLRLV